MLYETFALQKDNLFLWWPVFFALGIGLYFSFSFEPPFIVSLFIWLVSAALHLLLSLLRRRSSLGYGVVLFSFALLLASSGFLSSKIRSLTVQTPMIEKKINMTELIGTVEFIEHMEEGSGSRIILSDLIIEDLDAESTPRKVRLRLRKDMGLDLGQRIKVLAGLTPPSSPIIPGGFDFRRFLYFKSIGAVGFIYKQPEILKAADPKLFSIETIRFKISERVSTILSPEHASIAMALIVGQKKAISESDRNAIRNAGLAHMLAISGLHVGLVAGTLFFILRFLMSCIPHLALKYPIKKITAVAALFGAVFYMLLAGSTIPTQRAVLMTSIVFLAIILDRSPISLRLVSFSALVVLVISPESLVSASFHMSFAAVTALIYFYDVTRKFWIDVYQNLTWFKRFALYFIGVCLTTLIASVSTAPFALYHFGQVSVLGSLANVLAVPLLAFIIMPFALLALVAMPFGLDVAPFYVVSIGIQSMLDIAHWAAALPHAIAKAQFWNFSSFLVFIVAAIWGILWKGKGKLLALPLFALSASLFMTHQLPDILIAPSHKLFAFRIDTELHVSSKRSDKFTRSNWERFYGLEPNSALLLPYKGNNQKGQPSCGEEFCRFTYGNHNVSFLRTEYNLARECIWADIVILEGYIAANKFDKNFCPNSIYIDRSQKYQGAHAVWFTNDETKSNIFIKTSGNISGHRPWTTAYKLKN